MREIEFWNSFKRDYKRELKGEFRSYLSEEMANVQELLCADKPLAPRHKDHKLIGKWLGCRECHVKPDLLLIYQKTGDNLLTFVRLGTHSELFG